MTQPLSPRKSRQQRTLVLVAFLLLAAFLIWKFLLPSDESMLLAQRKNNEGVALMEMFDYGGAKKRFEEVHQLAPDWIPGKINLAIATLNLNTPETTDEAAKLCLEVLQQEPKHPHANYLLGIIYLHRQQFPQAHPYFQAVVEIDPQDAYSWYYLGDTHPNGRDSKEALECYEKALKVDPYLNVARYRIAFHPEMNDPAKRKAFLQEHRDLQNAFWEVQTRIRYYDMGPYARVIGAEPRSQGDAKVGPIPAFEPWDGLKVQLAEGTRWATREDFGWELRGGKRPQGLKNFGMFAPVIIRLDYDRDGRIDLLLLSGGFREGKVRNLLFKNEGNGRFTDVTATAGLGEVQTCFGGAVGDFDNDGFPDLSLNGPYHQYLLRNRGNGTFEDVSAKAGLDQVKGVYRTSLWVDLDQDGDLDLLLAAYMPEDLNGKKSLVVLLNSGIAPAVEVGNKPEPLSVAFTPLSAEKGLNATAILHSLLVTDFDADQDLDMILFESPGGSPRAIRNHRLLRFEETKFFPPEFSSTHSGLVLDVNHDQKSDLFLLSDRPPQMLLSKAGYQDGDPAKWFTPGIVDSPPLSHAFAVDLDLDSWTDVVGLSGNEDGSVVVFLQNDGQGRLVHQRDTFGLDLPKSILSIACLDLDDDCYSDLLIWTEQGLSARRNLGNGNRAIQVQISGKRSTTDTITERTNADGIGAMVVMQSGDLRNSQEYTTLSAGTGQSLVPLEFGIGRQTQADVIRIRWPDLIPQAETKIEACKLRKIEEINRKPTSCPTLLVWDGEKYRFVSDILGAGSMGELGADGSTRPPRPEESFKIEPGVMKAKDGKYLIKLAEPMDETMYLDRLELLAVDHPKHQFIYPDERFPTDRNPSQEILFLDHKIFPAKITDHRGRDKTKTLSEWDGIHVDDFAHRRWPGFAEDHYLEFDFGDALQSVTKDDRLYLCLAGWTDYAYPESIFAAAQAKIEMHLPTLEVQQADGSWKPFLEVSLPAGLPRMMTREVTGLASSKFRLRTNLQVYWDQVFLAVRVRQESTPPTSLSLQSANLTHRGFMKEIPAKGRGPIAYDDSLTERVEVTNWKGRFTRLGEVTELLRETDDQFVICGPGDEIMLAFDANSLPPLREGQERSFVLRAWGYCKDTTPFTAHGGEIGPLPYRTMGTYPPPKPNPNPAQQRYDARWNTRQQEKREDSFFSND